MAMYRHSSDVKHVDSIVCRNANCDQTELDNQEKLQFLCVILVHGLFHRCRSKEFVRMLSPAHLSTRRSERRDAVSEQLFISNVIKQHRINSLERV